MSRVFHGIEKGLDIYAENGDLQVRLLSGSDAPDGIGDQSSAPIGSLYARSGTGELYQKIANSESASDWEKNGAGDAVVGTWRGESVVALTNEVQGAGTRDMVANPFSDDDGTKLPISHFVVGKYVITGASTSPVLLEITGVTGDDVTFALASTALVQDDTFVVKAYLPDPDGFENTAIVNYNGSVMIKIADVDWNFADGISMAAGYAAQNGSISSADSVNSAIEKLDGNQQDLQTLSGVAQGSEDLGTFTGSTIADNQTVKSALQDLESAHEITDQKADDLITLSGVAANSEDLGSWTSPVDLLFSATSTVKALFQRIGDLLMQLRGVEINNVTTAATIDSVPVSDVGACKWLVEARLESDLARRQALEIYALNNGTLVDDTVFAKLRVGTPFNLSISVDIDAGQMRLRGASTTGAVTIIARRVEVVNTLL